MKGFDFYLIKSHKQIPINPQLVLVKKHAHYASATKSSNQIQIKLQVLQNKLLNPSFDSINKKLQVWTKFQLQDIL
jgi:hypothetical protein